MTSPADNSVQGGIEVSQLTRASRAADEQKNRNGPQRRKRRKRKPDPAPETPQDVEEAAGNEADPDDDAEPKPTVDYLA